MYHRCKENAKKKKKPYVHKTIQQARCYGENYSELKI